jgi:uncharacterized repeat protein (TIGR01451 family)
VSVPVVRLIGCALLISVVAGRPARVEAATACGTMITNAASISLSSGYPDFVAYQMTYSITAVLTVLCPPSVKLVRRVWPEMEAAGGTMTFSVCVVNDLLETIWGITVTDRLPDNVTFGGPGFGDYDTTNGGQFILGGALTNSNASAMAGPWSTGLPAVGQAAPSYLRWVVGAVGPAKSACLTYIVRVI